MAQQIDTSSAQIGIDDPILEIRDARVTFDMSRGRARVIDDISVDVQRGETFAVIGESGCGKSTFGSILMDAVEDPGILTGEIRYYPESGGDPINLLELTNRQLRTVRWEEISVVSQAATNSFNPTTTIRRHFTETFDAHDVDRVEGIERAREVLEELNLNSDRILSSHQHELSGGEKQRTLLALSLVFEPNVLILDEPTTGLDLLVQRNFLSLLHDIKDEYELTLIFISHDIPVVAGFADTVGVMYAFDFVEFGSANDVLLHPEHPYTRLLSQSKLTLDSAIDSVQKIEGEPPDPINVPSGCPFHPRCPIADDRCEVEEPELRSPEGSNHSVACFYPDLAVDRIPLSIEYKEGDDQ